MVGKIFWIILEEFLKIKYIQSINSKSHIVGISKIEVEGENKK